MLRASCRMARSFRHRLGIGSVCAPSLVGVGSVAGEDGVHPGRLSGRSFQGVGLVSEKPAVHVLGTAR